MKIEEFKNISDSKGKPNPLMTNTQWQEYFNIMKLSIQQSKNKRMKASSSPIVVNHYMADNQFTYCGETQWTKYRNYINSVLSAIRKGEYDYCYFVYQIADLLKYEHDNLRTLWMPEYGCFQVWLNA